MHTKPISTEVIASYEATLISGFAKIRFNTETGKFNFDPNDTSDLLRPFRDATVNALNQQSSLSAIDMLDTIKKLEIIEDEGDAEMEHRHVHTVFQATVAYPYIRNNCIVTKAMAEVLQQQIRAHLPKKVNPKLTEYFKKVDDYCINTYSSSEVESNGFFMMGYEKAFNSLKDGSFLNNFERRLACVNEITKSFEHRDMTAHENEELFDDLSAANLFYEILDGTEKATRTKTRSALICESIFDALESFSLKSDEELKGRDVFKFLQNFHYADKCFHAISACSRLVRHIDPDQQSIEIAKAYDLLKFCKAFPDEGMSNKLYDQKLLIKIDEFLELKEGPNKVVFDVISETDC